MRSKIQGVVVAAFVLLAGAAPVLAHHSITSEFDPAISDFQMPGITGYERCLEIKADPAMRKMPVILPISLQME